MRIKQSSGSLLPQNVSGVTSVAPLCVSETGERGYLKVVSAGIFRWEDVGTAIQICLRKILGREILCKASPCEYDYWSVRFYGSKLNREDLEILFSSVSADEETREDTCCEDNEQAFGSIGCLLSEKLLQKMLSMSWRKTISEAEELIMIDCRIRRQNNG